MGCGPIERRNRGKRRGDTRYLVGSGCPATVVVEVIPSSPKMIVEGGSSFGAVGGLVS